MNVLIIFEPEGIKNSRNLFGNAQYVFNVAIGLEGEYDVEGFRYPTRGWAWRDLDKHDEDCA